MALLLSGACAVSLLSVNSASTGGNSATYLIGEGKGAQRNLPRILLGSTVMVIVFDVALSAAREGQGEVGCIAARYVVGPAGAAALSVILPRGTIICLVPHRPAEAGFGFALIPTGVALYFVVRSGERAARDEESRLARRASATKPNPSIPPRFSLRPSCRTKTGTRSRV